MDLHNIILHWRYFLPSFSSSSLRCVFFSPLSFNALYFTLVALSVFHHVIIWMVTRNIEYPDNWMCQSVILEKLLKINIQIQIYIEFACNKVSCSFDSIATAAAAAAVPCHFVLSNCVAFYFATNNTTINGWNKKIAHTENGCSTSENQHKMRKIVFVRNKTGNINWKW